MTIRAPSKFGLSPAMVKIYEETLAAAGKFDVTNIPLSFTHLLVQMLLRGDVSDTLEQGFVYYNNDTTAANYRRIRHTAGTVGHTVQGTNDSETIGSVGSTATAGNFSIHRMHLMYYSNPNVTKSAILFELRREADNNMNETHKTLHWENTAAINRITVQTDNDPTDQWIAGSKLEIYGIY